MIDASLYSPIFIFTTLFLILVESVQVCGLSDVQLTGQQRGSKLVLLYALLFIIFVGLRPISGVFVDTVNYANMYYAYQYGYKDIVDSESNDWLFDQIMYLCSQRMDVQQFFLIIEACYIVPMVIACRRFFPNNSVIAILFCFSAFSFFSYGVNGIRNGMATSLVILALSFIDGSMKNKIIVAVLCFAAMSIHKSTALPVLMMVVSIFYKNTKMILWGWVASIGISLVAGAVMENFFAGLGFDDRLSDYITSDENDGQFSNTGFRFDFLLYSVMPIVLGYYTVIKRKIADNNYLLLLHTYVLCNAFWVMLIRASFSNRFAYLSWFLYPIVLAYPLLKLKIWGDQGKWCAWILLAHFGFTFLMWLR